MSWSVDARKLFESYEIECVGRATAAGPFRRDQDVDLRVATIPDIVRDLDAQIVTVAAVAVEKDSKRLRAVGILLS